MSKFKSQCDQKSQVVFNHITFPTPFGKGAIIYRSSPFLISRIILPQPTGKVLAEAIRNNRGGKHRVHQKAITIRKSIIDYFNGAPLVFDMKLIDIGNDLTKLQKAVLTATIGIEYGKLSTYKNIAVAIGKPRAYRFVGTTLAKNRFPILIPCHRVVRSDFSIRQFAGGSDLKKKMIKLEALGCG